VAAAIILGGTSEAQARAFDENVAATYALVRWCEESGVSRLIYSSSASVYARTEKSIDEHAALEPLTPYAAGKLAGEWLVSSRLLRTVSSVILRYTSIYGEGQRSTSVLPVFVRAAREGRRPAIHGSGARSQDFVHVDDICEANRLALDADLPSGEVFNIGSGEETSMLALAEAVVERFGGDGLDRIAMEQEDLTRVRFDVTKARRVLGYSPRGLREGLRSY
jgi:UDP-glucose 4-epimerase